MLSTGLTSITFRQLSVDEIIELAQEAKIQSIEWGGDVHVPPGDTELAAKVKQKTEAAGLSVCAYGSYYRSMDDFSPVLETADALGASIIRIWAGNIGSLEATQSFRDTVAERIRRAVVTSAEMDITIALEYHGGTLTDTQESAHRLLREVGDERLKLFWQPRAKGTFSNDLTELDAALPYLSNVHLFHWGPEGYKNRLSLEEGFTNWKAYIERIRSIEGDRTITFEFVKGDLPEQFLEDAKILHKLLVATEPKPTQ